MNKIVQDGSTGPKLAISNPEAASTARRARVPDLSECDLAKLILSSSHRARGLDEGVDLLRDWLPGFEKIISTTANGCTVMSEIGIYQKPMLTGEKLQFDNSGIAIRLLPAAIEALVALDADPANRLPPCLQIFDAMGSTVHTSYIASISDQLTFDVLMYGTKERNLAQCLPSPVLSFLSEALKPVGGLPEASFNTLGLAANLDACLLNGGTARYKRLKSLPRTEAWQVDRQVVPHLLRYLSNLRQPLLLGVPNSTCLQLKAGRLDSVTLLGDLIEITAGACRTYFDPAGVAEFWIVRSQESVSLEAYTKTGTCALLLAQDRAPDSRFNKSWIEILESLPTRRGAGS